MLRRKKPTDQSDHTARTAQRVNRHLMRHIHRVRVVHLQNDVPDPDAAIPCHATLKKKLEE